MSNQNEMLDYNNLTIDSNLDFESLLEAYSGNPEAHDPEIGAQFIVKSILAENNKIFAEISAGIYCELELGKDLDFFTNILIKEDVKDLNKKDLLNYIRNNSEQLNSKFEAGEYSVQINAKRNGTVLGSIFDCYYENIKGQFFNQLRYNKIIEEYNTSKYKETSVTEGDYITASKNLKYYLCKIEDMNKGGYIGSVEGIDVFMPGSLAAVGQIEDHSSLIGTEIPVMIESYLKDRKVFIVSYKKYINTIAPEKLKELDKETKLKGNISGISNFGIFIIFNEILSGLLHISEMTEETLEKFNNKEFKVGEEIEFFFKNYMNDKIILSEKSPSRIEEEWKESQDKYSNQTIKAKLIKRVSLGYLFELEPGIRGLLYNSEAPKYTEELEVGKNYDVYVSKMDEVTSKIYLKCPKA